MKIAAIATGADGGWIARLVLAGHDVTLFAPGPDATRAVEETIARARHAWQRLFQAPLPAPGRITRAIKMAAAVADADYIHVADPLTPDLLAALEAAAPATAIIAAAAPDAPLADLRRAARHPERLLVVNIPEPAYLMPVAEIIGGGAASDRTAALLSATGILPIEIPRDNASPISPRLRRALWSEALALVHDGAASAGQIDAIMTGGLGLVLAQSGLFQGLRDSPASPDPEHTGDAALIALLQALGPDGPAAGRAIAAQARALYARAPGDADDYPLRLHQARVPGRWIDYNGHMTEFRYLQFMGDATDAFLIHVGLGPDYRASGHSAYTVETHIRHLAEVGAGELLSARTRLLGHDAKRIRLHHSILREDGTEVATGEHMLLHVDSTAGRACPLPPNLVAALDRIAAREDKAHPDHAGRGIRETGPSKGG